MEMLNVVQAVKILDTLQYAPPIHFGNKPCNPCNPCKPCILSGSVGWVVWCCTLPSKVAGSILSTDNYLSSERTT